MSDAILIQSFNSTSLESISTSYSKIAYLSHTPHQPCSHRRVALEGSGGTDRIRLPCALLGVTSDGNSLSPSVVRTGMSPSAVACGGETGVVAPEAARTDSLWDQDEKARTEDELAKTESSLGSWNLVVEVCVSKGEAGMVRARLTLTETAGCEGKAGGLASPSDVDRLETGYSL